MDLDAFTALLTRRIRSRYDMGNGGRADDDRLPETGVFSLDLRAKVFGNRAPLVMRDHRAPGWPTSGTPLAAPVRADDAVARKAYDTALATAGLYVVRHYAPLLHRELYPQFYPTLPDVTGESLTTAEACAAFLEHIVSVLGADHNTVRTRRSEIRTHILPALGARVLKEVTAGEVRNVLANLRVQEFNGPRSELRVPASLGTKRSVLRAIRAIWKHAFPDMRSPFGGVISVDDGSARRSNRDAIQAGKLDGLIAGKTGALDPKDVVRALTAAAAYDRRLTNDPRYRHIGVPNCAALMATQIATGCRIRELVYLRWSMIDEVQGVILVPGTKTEGALRLIPLQDALRPWLAELKRIQYPDGREPVGTDFVFSTSARTPKSGRPNQRKLIGKMSHALELAGLKIPRVSMDSKATHWARATHISWGTTATELIAPEWLSWYVGHGGDRRFHETTGLYMTVRPSTMPRSHREYIRHLPSPTAVNAMLATFEPSPVRSWRQRGRVRQRLNSATD